MDAIWKASAELPHFEPLRGDIQTDVLIVGGGIAGLLCAHRLAQDGVRTVVVEASEICSGTTGKTTAKITSQHGLIYDELIRRFGAERAGMYLRANEEALEEYRVLCRNMDCGFAEHDACVYSADRPERIERELKAVQRLGFPARAADRLPLPFPATGIVFPRQAEFHPLKFLGAIVKELTVYEHTAVRELIGTRARTDNGSIAAEKIIVATHFPFLNKHGSYFLKLYQQRSYVLALEGAADVRGMYIDERENGLSFRNSGELLLLGGGGHRTGKQGGCWQALSDFAAKAYPGAREVARWATQDCMTLDRMPYIGRYSARTENLFVATGFGKWGMTTAMAAAGILADLVQGRDNPYAALFSPSRSFLRPQLAVNGWEAVASLLTPTTRRCPHMGCALKWNAQEHSWDCPCHGSRFTEEGKLIDNPATGDLPGSRQ